MRTRLGYRDGEAFIARMERAQADGDLDFVAANMKALEKLIGRLEDRSFELTQLQYRARMVREKHEPPGDRKASWLGGSGRRAP